MTSITRTLTLSLSVAAAAIFLVLLSTVIWLDVAREREQTYGFDDEIESNTLEAQVSRLRKKLAELGGDVEIRSMRGIGYILRMTQTR